MGLPATISPGGVSGEFDAEEVDRETAPGTAALLGFKMVDMFSGEKERQLKFWKTEVNAKHEAAQLLVLATTRKRNAVDELENATADVKKLLTDRTANAQRVKEASQEAVFNMTNLIRDGLYLKDAHAWLVVLVPAMPTSMNGMRNAPATSVRAAMTAIESVVIALLARELDVDTYESAVNVATAALHMHYFGPVPKTHKPYTYKDFVVCLKTNMLNHQIHEYAQFLRPLPEQDPTN